MRTIEQAGELRAARMESLRAIAALGMVAAHVMVLTLGAPILATATQDRAVLVGGAYGVWLFLALSGYLLFWPFVRGWFGGGEAIDLRRYATNRVLRIVPLYLIVVATLFVVQEGGGSPKEWLLFAAFAQNFSADTLTQVNPVLWAVAVEVHFYALLPLMALLLARVARGSLRRAALALGVAAAASLALRVVTVSLDSMPDPYLRYSLPSVFFFFATGMLLALLRAAWDGRRPPWLRGAAARTDVWIAAAVTIWLAAAFDARAEPVFAMAAFLLVGACVLPLEHGRLLGVLDWRPLAAVGVVSYSVYLWHYPLAELLIDEGWLPDRYLARLAIGLPLVVAAAFASYRVLEAPFLQLRRRWAAAAAPQVG